MCTAGLNGPIVVGPVFRVPCILASCQCNAVNALVNRHLSVALKEFSRGRELVGWLREYLAGLGVIKWSETLYEEWLSRFTPSRARAIHDAFLFGKHRGFHVTLTIKREVTKPDATKARGIQAYTDLFVQAITGPVIWELSRRIKERGPVKIRGVWVHYAPGYTADMIHEAVRSAPSHYHWLECDGKNWDAGVSEQARHAIISGVADHLPRDAVDFLRDGVKVTGVCAAGRGFLRYRACGTVKSGHNDTTLGNTLLNLAANAISMPSGFVMCAGDDAIVGGLLEDLKANAAALPQFGITPEGGIFRHVSEVTFISGRFYGSGFGPKIGNQLCKFYATAATVRKSELNGFADRMRASVPHFLRFPILRALAAGPVGVPLPTSRFEQRDGRADVHDVCEIYGISPDDVVEFEDFLLDLRGRPCIIKPEDVPRVARIIIELDSCEPADRPACVYRIRSA